jgi:uncharacterized membrane protein
MWVLPGVVVSLFLIIHGIQDSRLNKVEGMCAEAVVERSENALVNEVCRESIHELKEDVKIIKQDLIEQGNRLERLDTNTQHILNELRKMNNK